MNSYKLVVVDLDDTILRDDKTISDFTRDVILKLRSLNIKFAFATARGQSTKKLIEEGIFDAYIQNNGATVFTDNATIQERLISPEIYRPYLHQLDQEGFIVGAESASHHLVNFDVQSVWPYVRNYTRTDFTEITAGPAEKLYVLTRNPQEADYIKVNIPDGLHCRVSRDGMAMIMDAEANKGEGIKALAAHYGYDRSEVIVFGDDTNDLDMFREAGLAIAMQNAIPEIQAVADFICGSNNEDGVAYWLRENILNDGGLK